MVAPTILYEYGEDVNIATGPRAGNPLKNPTYTQALARQAIVPGMVWLADNDNTAFNNMYLWLRFFREEGSTGIYGDGSDGAQVVNANATLTQAMYYTDLTVNSGAVLTTAGYPIFCTGTLTVDGVGSAIDWSGNDGAVAVGVVGGVAGAALAAAALGGSAAGGTGGAQGAVGIAGANTGLTVLGNSGGAGGAAAPGAGGAGGTSTTTTTDIRSVAVPSRMGQVVDAASGLTLVTGGAGGGGGSGAGVGDGGGGGGSGGGVVIIFARRIVLTNSGAITANGGDGADAAIEAGGGGGGGGGTMYLIRREIDSAGGSITVTGGAGGATGGGAGVAGSAGAVGSIIQLTG